MSLQEQLAKSQRRTCPTRVTVSYIAASLLLETVESILLCREEAQGLLGERVANTPEASSMVFLRAVSLATLWLSRLRRS